ncbi:MAG: ABC transporter permease [Bradyrhizobiaceae bacterium]|nr:ABC transporter permease [Bradyrhizobiaceae bacterium]
MIGCTLSKRLSQRRSWAAGILGLPMILLLGLFFAVPLLMAFSFAFRPFDAKTLVGEDLTLQNFGRFLFDGFYLTAFVRTTLISLSVTILSVVLGYPVAWHLRSVQSSRLRTWLVLVVLMPLMLSLVIASFAWMIILGSNGVLANLIASVTLLQQPLRLLNTDLGIVIVTVYSFMSYSVLSIYAALENIDPSLARAASIHGANDRQVFLHVIWPLSIPGVVSGALVVFALSMAAFVVPYLIGGGRVKVIPLLIYNFTIQLFDWPGAAALSLLLFLLTLVLTWLIATLGSRLARWEAE